MQKRCSVDQATVQRRPRQAITSGARRHLSRAMAAVFLPLLALLVMVVPAAGAVTPAGADTAPAVTFTASGAVASCPAGTYSVPAGTRYVEVIAIGGAGRGGWTFNDNNTGGPGGSGARVRAILPVTPGQDLKFVVAHNGDAADPSAGFPNGGATNFASGKGGGSSVVTTSAGDPCLGASAPRGEVLVLAGGGGGGGGATTFGSGGAGGNAGVNPDLSGQAGSRAYGLSTDSANGHGGGGGTATAAGSGGNGGCAIYCARPGLAGTGFTGGKGRPSFYDDDGGEAAGGAGGGGYYGGGGGGGGNSLGGGGGGAGSSYLTPSARGSIVSTDTSGTPSVTITPYQTPTTTATFTPMNTNDWYTSAPWITLRPSAGSQYVAKTYYALDNPACSATNVAACQTYIDDIPPVRIFVNTNGLHTLTYFSVDTEGVDEAVQTKSFAVTLTYAGVTAASLGSGTNPTATAGGAAGAAGSVSVSSTGTGVVGAAVYGSNPAGAPVFNSSGAYVDVIVAGSGLSSLTIIDCNLSGGNSVYWYTGTAWALVSNQMYDAKTGCVTITVDSTTRPTVSELTGTVIAAGSPPTTTAVATTADVKPYTAGTWTKQSVTVAFTCTANATPTGPVTRASDGQNQSASGTCTDGLGQQTTTTFTGINVDKTPPTCSIRVSPTVLWSPYSKPVAITGTVTVGDTLSGIARVVGGTITSNEVLGPGDVRGFTVNATYASPLQLSAALNLTGTLMAKRAGDGSGRIYSQLVTVTDQAGNTASCTWTVTVPRDQR